MLLLTVINSGHTGPEFPFLQSGNGVGGLLTSVRAVPVALEQVKLGVRRVLEDVVLARLVSNLNLTDLLTNANHGLDEAVELLLALTLCGLNHEGVGDRPAHGRGVEAVVLETLGNVNYFNAGSLLEGAGINDELVSAATFIVGVKDGVVVLETGEDVVGIEKSHGGGLAETSVTHGRDVSPADGNNAGTAKARAGNRDLVLLVRQVGSEMLLDANGADTRATTTVGDTERLVEVQVADISTKSTGRGQANLCIHVCAIHVNLATILVNNIADLADLRLKYTIGTGVGDHDGSELSLVLLALGFEVGKIEITGTGVALDGHDAHASHGGGGRVGAVGRDGDQANVTLGAGLLLVVLADSTKAGELSLGTRVGLQAGGIHTSEGGQLLRGSLKELGVALNLRHGSVGVNVRGGLAANELHLGGTVELHGARAQRDHGVDKRKILGLQVVDIAEHLGLAVVRIEDGVGEELGLSANFLGQAADDLLGAGLVGFAPELAGDVHVVLSLVLGRNVLEGGNDVDVGCEVESGGDGQDDIVGGPFTATADAILRQVAVEGTAGDGVVEVESDSVRQNTALGVNGRSCDLETVVLSGRLDSTGVTEVADGHFAELLRAVIDGVHGRHVGEEGLGRADVAGGLFTTNVLLAGLKSKTKSTSASAVLGDTDNTAGKTALAGFLSGHESGVGTTKAERNTPALGVTKRNISAPFTGRSEEGQGRDIGSARKQSSLSVSEVSQILEVTNATVGIGVLDHDTDEVVTESLDLILGVGRREVHDLDFDVEALSTAMHDADGGVVKHVGDDIRLVGSLGAGSGEAVPGHGHGLGGSSAFVEKRGIGDRKTSEVSNHGLEVEERLKTALANLGLVGSVAGVPCRVLENVALNDGGNLDRVVSAAVHPRLDNIGRSHFFEGLGYTSLAEGNRLDCLLRRKHDILGDDLRKEGIH